MTGMKKLYVFIYLHFDEFSNNVKQNVLYGHLFSHLFWLPIRSETNPSRNMGVSIVELSLGLTALKQKWWYKAVCRDKRYSVSPFSGEIYGWKLFFDVKGGSCSSLFYVNCFLLIKTVMFYVILIHSTNIYGGSSNTKKDWDTAFVFEGLPDDLFGKTYLNCCNIAQSLYWLVHGVMSEQGSRESTYLSEPGVRKSGMLRKS